MKKPFNYVYAYLIFTILSVILIDIFIFELYSHPYKDVSYKVETFRNNDSFSDTICYIDNLKEIHFVGFTGCEIPKCLPKMKDLVGIKIDDSCCFDLNLLFELVSPLKKFRAIYFKNINLTEIPTKIKLLKNLQSIHICNSPNLHSIPDDLFSLEKLTDIDFKNCKIMNISNIILKLSNLQTINFENNNMNNLPSNLESLKSLTGLVLSGNPKLNYKNVIISLQNNDSLIELYIGRNNLKKIPNEILKLKHLNRLGIQDNDLKIIPDIITKMDCVEELWLQNNNLTNIDKLIKMKHLRRLYLENNKIRRISKNFEKLLDKGITVNLKGNPLDSNDVARIKRKFPFNLIVF